MKDPLTKEEFVPKRSNQLFASPENRIKYNNNKANKKRKQRAFVDKPLHNNLNIIQEIMNQEKSKKVHREFLLGKGFDFKIYNSTCIVKDKKGYCIYNFILTYIEDYVRIIRNN